MKKPLDDWMQWILVNWVLVSFIMFYSILFGTAAGGLTAFGLDFVIRRIGWRTGLFTVFPTPGAGTTGISTLCIAGLFIWTFFNLQYHCDSRQYGFRDSGRIFVQGIVRALIFMAVLFFGIAGFGWLAKG